MVLPVVLLLLFFVPDLCFFWRLILFMFLPIFSIGAAPCHDSNCVCGVGTVVLLVIVRVCDGNGRSIYIYIYVGGHGGGHGDCGDDAHMFAYACF